MFNLVLFIDSPQPIVDSRYCRFDVSRVSIGNFKIYYRYRQYYWQFYIQYCWYYCDFYQHKAITIDTNDRIDCFQWCCFKCITIDTVETIYSRRTIDSTKSHKKVDILNIFWYQLSIVKISIILQHEFD